DTLRLTDAAMSSLDDLRYFDNLVYLEIGFNNLITFQNLPASLQTLVFDNPMSMLGSFTLPPGLKKLVLKQDEFLSYVPAAWPAGLKFLDLSGCGYTSLTNLPASLDTLIIAGQVDVNGLTVPNGNVYPSLTTLAIPANLKYLDCSRNGLATLNDIPNSLTWLDCSQQYSVVDDPMTFAYKQIPKLNQIDHLSNNLVELYCHTNSLSSLPALPASLKVLSAYYNKYNINFSYFNGSSVNFSNAGISTVPDFPNGLTTIRLNLNNISCLPYIPATVTSFYINQNPLNCLPNSLPGGLVNTDATAIPLCNAVNNSYQCERHPIISGNIFYDNNLNGTQDPGELPRAYVR
ncbi:MAG TPA: hypothetical protein PKK69_11635, partial [Ferruginibacter sp.]|nr:hypothetical protein [Ferruginibacter sp.]